VSTFDHINLSREPDYVIRQWLTVSNAIKAALRVISLPDTCPGKSPLPTGTAFLTADPGWRRFALSDVGSGNHFLDAAASHTDGSVCLVVHTGSRKESGLVDDLVDQPRKFDGEFARIRTWAHDNRSAVLDIAENRLGKFLRLTSDVERIDRDHNHIEERAEGMLIRKGVQRVPPGELAIIPSHLLDDMAIVRATPRVDSILNCLPHGTGRTMSRSDAKRVEFDFDSMRSAVYIPSQIDNASLRTEAPSCYRPLDDGLACMTGYIDVVERLTPVAYIGQL
jgi:RNA-splicing ligase RtcB